MDTGALRSHLTQSVSSGPVAAKASLKQGACFSDIRCSEALEFHRK